MTLAKSDRQAVAAATVAAWCEIMTETGLWERETGYALLAATWAVAEEHVDRESDPKIAAEIVARETRARHPQLLLPF